MLSAYAALLGAIAAGMTTIFSSGDIALSVSVFYNVLITFVCALLLSKVLKMSDRMDASNKVLTAVNDAVTELNKRIDHDQSH